MSGSIESQRGHNKFARDGFVYVFDKNSLKDDRLKFWRCEQKDRCKARIHTIGDEVVKYINEHNHDPSAANVGVQKFVTKIKNRAKASVESTNQVITECSTDICQAVQGTIPQKGALRKIIQRTRKEVLAVPANPGSLRDLHIPQDYRTYSVEGGLEEDFVLSDVGGDDKIVVLGRRSWLQHLRTEIWYADGTFKIAPPLFSQVYIISTAKLGGVIPVLFALLPNKQRSTYSKLFELLKQLDPLLAPHAINCDFEQAALVPMRQHFPDTEIHGCFFHLSQNFQKKLSENGLIQMYRDDPDFALQGKMGTVDEFPETQETPDLDSTEDLPTSHNPPEQQGPSNKSAAAAKVVTGPPARKRKRIDTEDPRLEEAYHIMKEAANKSNHPPNKFQSYGQHIANKMKEYSHTTQTEVEHAINEILYKADKGYYAQFSSVISPSVSSLGYMASSPSPDWSHSARSTPGPSADVGADRCDQGYATSSLFLGHNLAYSASGSSTPAPYCQARLNIQHDPSATQQKEFTPL